MVIKRLERLASVYKRNDLEYYEFCTRALIKLARKDLDNATRQVDICVRNSGKNNVKFFTDLRTYFLRLD